MKIFDNLFHKKSERTSKKYLWAFTGEQQVLQALCENFPAADVLYWETLFTGGFAIFDGALRFFSVCAEPEARNVIEWNKPETWKFEYKELLNEPIWCFAEDVFGNQFCFKNDGVYWLEAETGKLERLCSTFSEWKELVDSDVDYYTGCTFARAWYDLHDADDPLTPNKILMPLTPFFCNGDFDVSNLFPMEAREAMCLRGNVAYQIKDTPDGTPIEIQFRK